MAKKPEKHSTTPPNAKIRRAKKNSEHSESNHEERHAEPAPSREQAKKPAITVKDPENGNVDLSPAFPTMPPQDSDDSAKNALEAALNKSDSKTDTKKGGQHSHTPTSKKTPKSHKTDLRGPKEEAILKQADFMTFEQGSSDDFAALLSGSSTLPEKRRYRIGDEVTGTVFAIGETYIYVDLGASYEAIAKTDEFLDEDGELPFTVGDSVTFFVTDLRGGAITLGTHLNAEGPALEALEQAFASGLSIEGRVASVNKGGYVVAFGDVETFCPISQIDINFTEEPSIHVGNTYSFKVVEIRDDGRSIVVSRRAILEKEAKEARKRLLETLNPGDIVTGKVTRLTDFGAFVDLNGVEGLLHISEIDFVRVDHPSELLKVDENVKVEIVNIEHSDGKLKIGLSRKNCLQDPWETIYETSAPGTEVNGTVTRVETFGAFVEIAPGIEGLVHVSEMSWGKRIRHASDVVSVGDRILVRVKEVDPQRRRVSLTMKSIDADPWNDIDKVIKVGQEVTGTVDKVEDFGAFIQLQKPEVTALLPRSEMNLSRNETPYSKAIKGTEITARVLDIDKDRRRMALTLKTEAEITEAQRDKDAEPTHYQESATAGSGLGTLGDLLRKQLKD